MSLTIKFDGEISVRKFNKIKKYFLNNSKNLGEIRGHCYQERCAYSDITIIYTTDNQKPEEIKKSVKGLMEILFSKKS